MSAEHLMNDDLPDDTRPPKVPTPAEKPSYFDLVSMRIEAAARLSRSLKTLKDADVLGDDADKVNPTPMLSKALEMAETYWADICMGLTPVHIAGTIELRDNLPACIEAFRIVVMEHAQREALESECRKMIDHSGGFGLLTRPQMLHIEKKHVCDGDCDHGPESV